MKGRLPITLIMLWLAWGGIPTSADAVGPYMENERQTGTHVEGPVPDLLPPALTPTPRQGIVTGEVLRIEGKFYVVKEPYGNEVSLQVDNGTKMSIIPKLGDQIEAVVTSQGHAESISTKNCSPPCS